MILKAILIEKSRNCAKCALRVHSNTIEMALLISKFGICGFTITICDYVSVWIFNTGLFKMNPHIWNVRWCMIIATLHVCVECQAQLIGKLTKFHLLTGWESGFLSCCQTGQWATCATACRENWTYLTYHKRTVSLSFGVLHHWLSVSVHSGQWSLVQLVVVELRHVKTSLILEISTQSGGTIFPWRT